MSNLMDKSIVEKGVKEKHDFSKMTYKELSEYLLSFFQMKVSSFTLKEIDSYLPFKTLKERIFKLTNFSLSSVKKLFSDHSFLAFGDLFYSFHKGNKQEGMYKANIIFSPMNKYISNLESDLDYLSKLSDFFNLSNLNENEFLFSKEDLVGSQNILSNKVYLRKTKLNLFDETEDPKYYDLSNIYSFLFNRNDIIYLSTTYLDSVLYPKKMFKQVFVPILFNKSITKEIYIIPFDLYPDDFKEYIDSFDASSMIKFKFN